MDPFGDGLGVHFGPFWGPFWTLLGVILGSPVARTSARADTRRHAGMDTEETEWKQTKTHRSRARAVETRAHKYHEHVARFRWLPVVL